MQSVCIEPAVTVVATIDRPVVESDIDKVALVREEAIQLGGLAEQCAMMTVRIDCPSDQQWKICLSRDGAMALNYFQTGENGRKLAQAVSRRIGLDVSFEFVQTQEPTPVLEMAENPQTIEPTQMVHAHQPNIPQAQLIRNAMVHPLIKQFMDILEAQVVRVDPAQPPVSVPHLDFPKSNTSNAEDISLRESLRNEIRIETAAVE